MYRLTSSEQEIPSLAEENQAKWLNMYLKLKQYEDAEELGQLINAPIGTEHMVYFILNDSLAENKIKGDYYVSSPHSVIDVSTMGFWTGNPEDFPFNADFTRWDEEYFTSYQAAKEAIERMVIEQP